jgi:LysM repeat protein
VKGEERMSLIHVVQSGDTLWSMAKIGISVSLEDLRSGQISWAAIAIVPGQELLIIL